ncbi:MerR family transcriptional regulator [Pseudoxanthomonas sp. F11]|uniref:MerR family transcriptional regulator n=1 Tax=Pseudoxanthomonas sp. F11 TaxID=3126308 RepID=UPI00300C84C3
MAAKSGSALYTVGQVAKRAGLTVRTLHHYDAIGLLRPSARSPSGYRLYDAADIRRLHLIVSLKRTGIGLDAIAGILAGNDLDPREVIRQQIAELDRSIAQAGAAKEGLRLLLWTLEDDPGSADSLLGATGLLAEYQKYLPTLDIRGLLVRWRQAQPHWGPIAAAIRVCQSGGTDVLSPDVQRLAQRWMNVAMRVFGGELPVVLRWANMHQRSPATAVHAGLDPALLRYLGQAIEARLDALRRHLGDDGLARLDGSASSEWEQLAADGEALLASGARPDDRRVGALRRRYQDLLARTVRHDASLAARLRAAYEREPILSLGHFIGPELRALLDPP